jgi:malonyl-CoA/methylmalonyl-CoA synthetase
VTATNLKSALEATSKRFPDKIGIEFGGLTVTYGDLDLQVNRLANALRSLGVGRGDRVCLFLPNGLEMITCHFANQKLGAATVPLNILFQERELEAILDDSQAGTLICHEEKLELVTRVLGKLRAARSSPSQPVQSVLKNLIVARPEGESGAVPSLTDELAGISVQALDALLEDATSELIETDISEDDVAAICYTSGTTGRPKGAMLTHGNFLSNIATLVASWAWTDDDVLLLSLPLSHVHGLGVALHGAVLTGCRVKLMEKFDAEQVLGALARGCTLFMGVPAMYAKMLAAAELKRFDLNSMRLFISGSAPLPVEVFHRFKQSFGFTLLERYGMTETMMNASNPYDGERKPGSVGFPLAGVGLRIADENGNDLPAGEVGEVLIKGPNVFKGYWRNEAATQAAFVGDWFRTGDLGRIDSDEYVYLVGRKKDLIISGGYNIYPREVEEVLVSHPGVAEAAVVGVADPVKGETVKAFVALKPDQSASAEELIGFCRARLAAYKIPRTIEFVEKLPRTSSGKVVVRELPGMS